MGHRRSVARATTTRSARVGRADASQPPSTRCDMGAPNALAADLGLETMVRHRLVTPLCVLAALAPVAVTVGAALVAAAEIGGAHPLTVGPPRNVAEAIAVGDAATAARLADGGASVTAIAFVRAGLLAPQPILASPLEVAVMLDQAPTSA